MNGCSKRYLRATSRLRPLGHRRKSDVQISNGHPGDGLCYLGQHSGVAIKHVEAVKHPFDVVRLLYMQGRGLAISCDRETNKMISLGTKHVKILIKISDDGLD